MDKKKKFRYKGNLHDNTKAVYQADGCADITFINKGTAIVTIDSLPLAQNESFTDAAFGDEENVSTYQISYGAGTQILYVRKKMYV